jgi:uncharacterized small protein (DUF1192 family)
MFFNTTGSNKHKRTFTEGLRREYQENIWKNELHILRLNNELAMLTSELDALNAKLSEKGKSPASEEKKQVFVLERNIAHKRNEIAQIEGIKVQNEYGLNVLLPQYEQGQAA